MIIVCRLSVSSSVFRKCVGFGFELFQYEVFIVSVYRRFEFTMQGSVCVIGMVIEFAKHADRP